MLYQFADRLEEKGFSSLLPGRVSAGFVTSAELKAIAGPLGFADSTVESCLIANETFRSGVETYGDYTFTELRIFDPSSQTDDCMALYIKRDLFLVVDVLDEDHSTRAKFLRAVKRFSPQSVTLERLICAFIDELLGGDVGYIEKTRLHISELEEDVLARDVEDDFSQTLLTLKKKLQRLRNYYEQLLDILETLEANENDLFPTDTLLYISNMIKRITRLGEDVDSLNNEVVHLQDAYSTSLEMKMNRTMKYLTVLSTIFFPLTIIVGWYGMNFQAMPEFTWRWGYVYVILLSAAVIGLFYWLAKRQKWL